MTNLLDPISPRARNWARWFVAFAICGVAGYAIWIHETSVGPVVARVPDSFVVYVPPRDPAISVRIDDRGTRMPVLATDIALWSRGRTSSRGEVRLVFDRPIVAIRELSKRPSALSVVRPQLGYTTASWRMLVYDDTFAPALSLTHNAETLREPVYRLTVFVWNLGRKSITGPYYRPTRLTLNPPVRVLSANVVRATAPDICRFRIENVDRERGTRALAWNVLETGDGAAFFSLSGWMRHGTGAMVGRQGVRKSDFLV